MKNIENKKIYALVWSVLAICAVMVIVLTISEYRKPSTVNLDYSSSTDAASDYNDPITNYENNNKNDENSDINVEARIFEYYKSIGYDFSIENVIDIGNTQKLSVGMSRTQIYSVLGHPIYVPPKKIDRAKSSIEYPIIRTEHWVSYDNTVLKVTFTYHEPQNFDEYLKNNYGVESSNELDDKTRTAANLGYIDQNMIVSEISILSDVEIDNVTYSGGDAVVPNNNTHTVDNNTTYQAFGRGGLSYSDLCELNYALFGIDLSNTDSVDSHQ